MVWNLYAKPYRLQVFVRTERHTPAVGWRIGDAEGSKRIDSEGVYPTGTVVGNRNRTQLLSQNF